MNNNKIKLKARVAPVIAVAMIVSACNQSEVNDAVKGNEVNSAIAAQSQWPMFSGPKTSGQTTTELSVPYTWSVRSNRNILWQTELPAGGQSGISVWGDNVFFTTNKPLDTPKLEQLEADLKQTQSAYQSDYDNVIKTLVDDPKYKKLVVNVATSEEIWSKFLLNYKQTKLKQLSDIRLKRAVKKITRESPKAKAVAAAQKAYDDYIHQQNPQITASLKHYIAAKKQLAAKGMGKDIVLYCANAVDGQIKWQRTISGVIDTMYNYAFSDATSPTPVTDGEQVWVVNATGAMASFSMSGEQLWSKHWMPSTGRPFNKQYDTLVSEDFLFNVQPPLENDQNRNAQWNYIHAIDKYSGETKWVSTEALTHYNTPMLGTTASGKEALLIGRGGPHGVPEKEPGLSLIDLTGKTLWNWQPSSEALGKLEPWGATDIQIWNEDRAIWIAGKTKQKLFSIDSRTGKTQQTYDLSKVSRYIYNEQTKTHQLQQQEMLGFERQPYTLVLIDDALYYLVRYEPFIGYLNLATGEHLQLEIPTEVSNTNDSLTNFIWKKTHKTDQLNSRGQRHNTESRSQGDGTQKAFLASPIVVNNNIYFTNAHGLTYVVDTNVPFNEKALIAVNDLGNKSETYSLSSMAYANGMLYQRSLKAIYAITP
ncbi:PQQ-binding-like beta-propeller repeat protein [Thalassotalea crassostreae]|uniref:outer membrane protein assembly factor BamB family protein n=1 Tax=Thalassotalea crassostreae TaxID=1763536 RepID=UPI0009EDB4DC|nr:PQQ-binding-like beta-propeller repeat protein [Thalassotalea crassostreae]